MRLRGSEGKQYMSRLTVGKQQMCEIAKAISHEAKVIVFDEPSAALTDAEIDQLFRIIRDLRAKEYGIVYISHRMDEIKKITDRVTVMRDGQTVGTLVTAKCTKDDIIHMTGVWPMAGQPGSWCRDILKYKIGDTIYPIGMIIILVLVVIMSIVLNHTRVGRYIIAIGSNKEALKLSGVSVVRWHGGSHLIDPPKLP